jgi:hypothetical protein
MSLFEMSRHKRELMDPMDGDFPVNMSFRVKFWSKERLWKLLSMPFKWLFCKSTKTRKGDRVPGFWQNH